jgi:hypothetical protein
MANEITVNVSLGVRNGNLSDSFSPGALTFTQAAIGGPYPGYQTIGTTEETIPTTEITTLGWAVFRNLDATNYIRIGFSTGVYGIRLEPGEVACFRLNPGVTIYAIADTAACKLLVKIYQD